MPIYDLNEMDLESGQEPKAVDADKEYHLRILACDEGVDKNDHNYILPRFEIIDEPFSNDFTQFIHIPNKNWMDAKTLNKSKHGPRGFTSLLRAFGVDPVGRLNPSDDLPGKIGWAVLGKGDSEQYGEQNFIKRFVLPR